MKYLNLILTPEEKSRFEECRKFVKDNNPAVQKWGDMLAEIKEKALWRGEFESFDDYLDKEVGWTRNYSNRVIKAAFFRKQQIEQGKPAPSSEREARAMQADSKKETTAADLPKVADAPPASIRTNTDNTPGVVPVPMGTDNTGSNNNITSSSQEKPLPKQYADAAGRDKMGYPIPKDCYPNFANWKDMQHLATKLSILHHTIEEESKKPSWQHLNRQDWLIRLGDLIYELKNSQPAVVCPYCQGRNFETCTNCLGSGLVTAFFFERQTDKDLVKFRKIAIEQLKK